MQEYKTPLFHPNITQGSEKGFCRHTFSHPDILSSTCVLQVIEVILPMLCNYLSYWWEKGPENSPSGAECCTMVTSEHLSIILGNILRILNSNLGIDDAPWMKRIAGKFWGCEGISNNIPNELLHRSMRLHRIR